MAQYSDVDISLRVSDHSTHSPDRVLRESVVTVVSSTGHVRERADHDGVRP